MPNPTQAEVDLIFALNAVDTRAEQLDLIRRHVERESAKLRAYVSELEEQCDSIGLQKAQHAAGMNR